MTVLYEEGKGFSTLNTARSALTAMFCGKSNVMDHPLIKRFMKGIFELRPPAPRYSKVWDASLVLNYLRKLHPLRSLTLKEVTQKLVMLVSLLTAQRLQTLGFLDIKNLTLTKESATFELKGHLKQDRPGRKKSCLVLYGYPSDERLDVLSLLIHYIKITQPLRGSESNLFISYVEPHRRVSTETIARWIKEILTKSGVDVSVYRAHSTRAAAVSLASTKNVPVSEIIKVAGWTSERTFATFYKKPLTNVGTDFANALLGT